MDLLNQVDTSGFGAGIINATETVVPAADPNDSSAKQSGFFSGLGDVMSGLAGLFDNGLKIYTDANTALGQANAQIKNDTVNKTPVVVQTAPVFDQKTLLLMGGIVVGGVVLLLVAHKMKW